MKLLVVSVLVLVFIISTNALCGYESCPTLDPDLLNVHIVAHTHDDVGWLKTVDQYLYGTDRNIQFAGVRYILDSVIDSLLDNSDRRFIYVESAFFSRWWVKQTEARKLTVVQLVNEGRLQFVGGGWSMNDEACVHYTSLIDNMATGLRFLNDTFGTCGLPHVAWQIDPFGHSKEQANLFAQMGYDAFFYGRIDFEDQSNRESTQTMETVWQGSDSLDNSFLFSGLLGNRYSPPSGFCWDVTCSDDPINDDPNSPDYNVDTVVDNFLDTVQNWAAPYTSNNILVTFGDDFNYQAADMWFTNLDLLINYTNARQSSGSNVNVFYSNPACYSKAVNDRNLQFPQKTDDFFPYADGSSSYWTGYYTSRPALKRYERESDLLFQACKQVTALTPVSSDALENVDVMRDAMGILQHHDAVSGTEKQAVQDDYARRLYIGNEACASAISEAYNVGSSCHGMEGLNLEFCPLLNVSRCESMENNSTVAVTYYNPQARSVTAYIRIPVQDGEYTVTDSTGASVEFDYIPVPSPVISEGSLEGGSDNGPQTEIVFITSLPALGYKIFYVQQTSTTRTTQTKMKKIIPGEKLETVVDYVFSNGELNLVIANDTGLLVEVQRNNVSYPISQQFYYYVGAVGSGAYIFLPQSDTPVLIADTIQEMVWLEGSQVIELQQTFNDWVSQTIRMYTDANFIEFEWMIGPIPIDDDIGKEVITMYQSDLPTNGIFYTDANGRQQVLRELNTRFSYPYTQYEAVAGNYYPLTSRIGIVGSDSDGRKIEAIVDRAEGGSSIYDGEIEVMLHRRLLHDDGRGVGEALNEEAYGQGLVVRGKHRLFFASPQDEDYSYGARILQLDSFYQPIPTFSPQDGTFEDFTSNHILEASHFQSDSDNYPVNINLLSLEKEDATTLLIRLEHPFDASEDPNGYSTEASITLEGLLYNYEVLSIRETSLGGNQWLDEMQRFNWTTDDGQTYSEPAYNSQGISTTDTITLQPAQIRTFIVEIGEQSC